MLSVHASARAAFGALLCVGFLSPAPSSALDKRAQGKLSWTLHRVASEAERAEPLRALGRRFVDERAQRVTAVAVLASGARAEDLDEVVRSAGGTIEAVAEPPGWVKLSLPARALRRVSEHRAVRRLRTPYYPTRKAVANEGAAMIHAGEWIARHGADGAGVTVAVIDSGYQGLMDRIGSELPADTEITDAVTERLDDYEDPHGTACAEIIHDVAPGAHLVLFDIEDGVGWVSSLREVIRRGIPVISHSLGWPNAYPDDGQSPFAQWVDHVARRGLLFVTAAGNNTGKYYKGPFLDENGNGIIEFGDQNELLPVGVFAGGSGVSVRWDDPDGAASHDYDLFIVKEEFAENPVFEDNPAIVASSQDVQDGSGDPYEYVDVQVDEDQVLYAVIRQDPATPPNPEQRFSVWAKGSVHPAFATLTGTLSLPADADGALAVAAVDLSGQLEGFSSRGPTADGRVKPDLAAPDGVTTASYGTLGFSGTSAATPHVAGAAALLLSANPAATRTELRAQLERATPSLGDPAAKNNDIGFGILDLDLLP